ncbi:electron transport complex RnfABCDGE type C subunit [Clostridium sp. CAG:632]|jgi:electron transport complex protein RnfC|nr:electron transport complex RnfABCDGE type C subunit [Clostridium sp. CAG:632]
MSLLTFKGGIHPYEGKELTMDKPIETYLPKGELVYPLSQHIGAPAKPVVKKGDRVLVGQRIAEAGGFVSAHIHASVSGTVKNIEPRLTAGGTKAESIIIENDGEYEVMERPAPANWQEMDRKDLLEVIQDAGIVGMGGAGFPTHVKLSPKNPDSIDYIIVNGSECEPYLTSDYRRMLEEPEKVVTGLEIVLHMFPQASGIIAIEDNKPEAIRIMKEQTADHPKIQVNVMKTKYPEGAERQLIYANTGRYINSGMLPADAGCIVHNVDTVTAIYKAVVEGVPLIDRIITISGDDIVDPKNFKVLLGTSLQELIEAAGGYLDGEPEKIISGGPMMGKAMFSTEVPAVKGSSAVLCMKKDEVAACEPSNCIRCGRCVAVCPGRVNPTKLASLAEHGKLDAFVEQDGMECCECGCCSYVCPAKRHLTQTIAATRKAILAGRKK